MDGGAGPVSWAATWMLHLARASLEGGVLILVAWAAVRLLPRMSPTVRCWLWRLAYVKLFVALFWTLPVELPVLPVRTVSPPVVGGKGRVEEWTGGGTAPTPYAGAPRAVSTEPSAALPTPAAPTSPTLPPFPSLPLFLTAAWLLGAGWCITRLTRESITARKLRQTATPVRDGWLVETCAELCWSFGLRRAPKLLLAEGYGSPLLVGGANPAVLLPSVVLERYQPEEVRLMLAHELGHMRRGDLLWSWLPAVAHWIFFFHPLVWLANREWRLAQEIACDELAVRVTSAPVGEYGGVLVKVARQSRLNLQPGLATVGLEESPETLKTRLQAMKYLEGVSVWRVALAGVWLGLLAVAGLVPWRLTEQAEAGGLRYGWQPGRAYSYTVRIDAEDEEYQETQTGNLTYTTRSAEADGAVLTLSNSLMLQRRRRDGVPGVFPGGPPSYGPSPFAPPRELRVDARGQVLRSSGDTALPYALGDFAGLAVVPLPAEGRKTWEVTADRAVPESTEPESSPGWPRRVGFGPFSGPFENPSRATLPAREHARYSLGKPNGVLIPIHRESRLQSVETVNGVPRLELAGNSRIMFDRAAGVVRSLEFRGTLTRTGEHVIRRIPLTLSCTLADAAPAGTTAATAAAPNRLSDAEVNLLLADLRSGEAARKQSAVNRFAAATAGTRKTEVARALHPLLREEEFFVRHAAVRALKNWGGAESINPLLALLDDKNLAIRWAAIEALGALGDARAAAPVARRLAKSEDRLFAGQALRALGTPAEGAVLPLVTGGERNARSEACRIMKEIGTKRSVEALTAAAQSEDRTLAFVAEDALKAVRARLRL